MAPRPTTTRARVAKAVADSPLVKTAVFGGDPNPGRFLQAAGAAGVALDPRAARRRDRRRRGGDRRRDPAGLLRARVSARRRGAQAAMKEAEIHVHVRVGDGSGSSRGLRLRPVATTTCGSTGSTRHEHPAGRPAAADPPAHGRQGADAARGAAVHARAPRQGDRREVRRRGDGRASPLAVVVRRGHLAAAERGHHAGRRARRRPAGDEALRAPRHRDDVRRRAARDRRRRRSTSRRWCSPASSTPTSWPRSCTGGVPAVGLSGVDGGLLLARKQTGRRTSGSSGRSCT